MKEIKIKGRITPYTPQNAYRRISINDLPEAVRKKISAVELKNGARFVDVEVENNIIVNKRLCRIRKWNSYDYCWVIPTDKPAPPKKPRVCDELAFDAYIKFCRTGDWSRLFFSWERCGRGLFREKLVELLKEYGNKDCDNCKFKFRCFTEK